MLRRVPDYAASVAPCPTNPLFDAALTRHNRYRLSRLATKRITSTTDGFVTKLNAQGTALLFSTYLGGTADDEVDAVTADSQGNLWVSGTTASSDFPNQ